MNKEAMVMNREYALKQICKMITSGDIPKQIYDKYLSNTPIGFMNYKELCDYFGIVEKVESDE